MEMNFASKGVAGAGLGLGIAGTALSVLGGGLRNVLGGVNPRPDCHESCGSHGSDAATLALASSLMSRCSEHDTNVSRYEAGQAARIAELETEVKLRDANTYTDGKLLELYRYVDGKFACVENQISAQAVYNATNTSMLNCLNGQVAQLMALTKTVIPGSSICPEMMPRYNSWTAPTAPATAG